jgi:hypothetical protein
MMKRLPKKNKLELQLEFSTINQKDITFLAIKCFIANQIIMNSNIAKSIDLTTNGTFNLHKNNSTQPSKKDLASILIELSSLKEELDDLALMNQEKTLQNKS